VGGLGGRFEDGGADALDVFFHFVGPEPDDTKPRLNEPRRTNCIGLGVSVLAMLTAIHLDDESSLEAKEIDDIRPDRDLPSKPQAFKPAHPKSRPKPHFANAHGLAHAPCEHSIAINDRPMSHARPHTQASVDRL
jgi:hypothetical protein